ncbi:competence protein CoiA [Halobacillus sp. B23F22_1]|uniref:competence protein CoiA n=1 Tax=Halobacillus sp. B23F22_1 TaxID=3459514 RepID=UPI00373EA967
MFHAYDENGKLTSLYHYSLSTLEKVRKNSSFFCPVCKENLMIRAGQKITPHFAHFPTSTCEINRGESVYHEAGKRLLYQWLHGQGYQIEVEAFLPEIQQRPDLLLKHNKKRIAIEFQCATIPSGEVLKRTAGFRKAGIFPLWILGRNQLNQKGIYLVQHEQFHKSMVYFFQKQYCMYFLDVNAHAMTTVHQLNSTSVRSSFAFFQTSPLQAIRFPQLFKPSLTSFSPLYSMWEKQLYQFRTHYRKRVGSIESQWRQLLYLKGHHFSLIPSVCYLPVRSQLFLGEAPYVWQTKFILQHYMPRAIGDVITFPKRSIQTAVNSRSSLLYDEYLELLQQLGYVHRTRQQEWVKKRNICFHGNIDQAIAEDRRVVNELKRHNNI